MDTSAEVRLALAGGCLARGHLTEAIEIFEECLEGPLQNNCSVLFLCARACFENSEFERATSLLGRLRALAPAFRADEAQILRARAMVGLCELEVALDLFEQASRQSNNLEAKFRYAVLLRTAGRYAEAQTEFSNVVLAGLNVAHGQWEWVSRARQELSRAPGPF